MGAHLWIPALEARQLRGVSNLMRFGRNWQSSCIKVLLRALYEYIHARIKSCLHWSTGSSKLRLVNTKVAQTTGTVMTLVVAASVVWLIQIAEAAHIIPNVVRLLISHALKGAAIHIARLARSESKVSTVAVFFTSCAAGFHRFDSVWAAQELHGGTVVHAMLVADLVRWNGTPLVVNAGLAWCSGSGCCSFSSSCSFGGCSFGGRSRNRCSLGCCLGCCRLPPRWTETAQLVPAPLHGRVLITFIVSFPKLAKRFRPEGKEITILVCNASLNAIIK